MQYSHAFVARVRKRTSTIIILLALLIPAALHSQQQVTGTVRGELNNEIQPVEGAHVYWAGTRSGTVTDRKGRFQLQYSESPGTSLIVSHVQFRADTLVVPNPGEITITLTQARSAGEVEITATAPDTYIAPLTQKTEVITSDELEHAACCDLAGCFGTTATVQAEAVDIVTDTKQLSMLGLDGRYTQVLVDDVPQMVSGLNARFGVSFLPGPFIDRIYVSKGANSVIQGSDAFSGQVNVMLHESDGERPLLFNAFTNSFLEQQYNAYVMRSMDRWSGMLAVQGIRRGVRRDRNGDGFMDAPLTDRFSLFTKWMYENDGALLMRSGLKYTWEDRLGGSMDFEQERDLGGGRRYSQLIQNRRIEFYNRTEFPLGEQQALKLHLAGSRHQQQAWYGTTLFDAIEHSGYADIAYSSTWTDDQVLLAGASWQYSNLDASIDLGSNPHGKSYAGNHDDLISSPGIFVENASSFFEDRLGIVAGARVDYHRLDGAVLTPRAMLRYNLDEETTVRASAGTAYRNARPFLEHPAAFASWRDIVIEGDPRRERAVNFGANLTHMYTTGEIRGTLSLDAYRTVFSRQVVAEYDDDPSLVVFRNIDGTSAADNILLEATAEIAAATCRLAYTYSDNYEEINGETRRIPFTTLHRVLGVLHLSTEDESWQGTLTLEWHGEQTLPSTIASLPLTPGPTAAVPEPSRSFSLVHLHAQHRWDWLDIYVGVENLLDFRQQSPILNAQRPFERGFETAFVWGPVRGREVYAGIRTRVNVF
ncbi:TonB-dependent receptor [bacterium]|nr:TonB-dependent receptor [bacterium]